MFDVICYRLKGHLDYQSEIIPAGSSINDALEDIQNIEDTLRFTGFANKKEANNFIIKFQYK